MLDWLCPDKNLGRRITRDNVVPRGTLRTLVTGKELGSGLLDPRGTKVVFAHAHTATATEWLWRKEKMKSLKLELSTSRKWKVSTWQANTSR